MLILPNISRSTTRALLALGAEHESGEQVLSLAAARQASVAAAQRLRAPKDLGPERV